MRKILLLGLLLASTAALAQKNTTDLITEINTNLPNNTTGAITPTVLRQTLTDIVNSYLNTLTLCASNVSGAFPIYNATSGVWVCSTTGGTGSTAILNGGQQFTSATATSYIGVGTHIRGNGATPALSSCGTSPMILGSDLAGTIATGTATPTACTLTFAEPFISTPHCVLSWQSVLSQMTYTVTQTAISIVQTGTNGNLISYVCVAQAGG